jgi:hypothetical protein
MRRFHAPKQTSRPQHHSKCPYCGDVIADVLLVLAFGSVIVDLAQVEFMCCLDGVKALLVAWFSP